MIRQDAEIIGWIDGQPVSRHRLDDRIAALRGGPRAAALPEPGTGEYRQFVRWTAHVLFTEELCRRAIPQPPSAPAPLDAISAVQLGSINTAAWHCEPAVGAAFHRLLPEYAPETATATPIHWFRLSGAMGTGQPPAAPPPLSSLGWSTLDDLPGVLSEAARHAIPGAVTGPLRTETHWYYLRLDETARRPARTADPDRGIALRAFARWLDQRRQRSLRTAPGFEHPGDPSQPDNTHRH